MKILLFIDGLDSGGAQRQICGLAVFLRQQGHDVRLFHYKYGANFYMDYLKKNDVDLRTSYSSVYLALINYFKEVKKYKSDIIISFLNQPCIVSGIIKLMNNTHLIVSDRNTTINARFMDKVRFWFYKRADLIVPNSYSQTEYLANYYGHKVDRIEPIINFVDTGYFVPNMELNNTPIKVISVVARVVPQKNVTGLIKAVSEVAKKRSDFVVNWYGDLSNIEYVNKCKALIDELSADNFFIFKGEEKNILSVYTQSNALCLPSFIEGTPNVICEAMSCGLPIICSDICDNGRYVKEHENGFLFDPRNIESISSAIINFINSDKDTIKKYGINSRNKAIEYFSVSAFTNHWIKCINDVVNGK